MTSGTLYFLLALAVLTGAVWGVLASSAWTKHQANKFDTITDEDYRWLDSQLGES